jgi:hypothetical protein
MPALPRALLQDSVVSQQIASQSEGQASLIGVRRIWLSAGLINYKSAEEHFALKPYSLKALRLEGPRAGVAPAAGSREGRPVAGR